MADLVPGPGPLQAGRPILVSAAGGTGSGPVVLQDSRVEVQGSTVRIETWFYLGPWAMPDLWEESFTIPPLEAGIYTLELRIWDEVAEEMVLNSVTAFQAQAAVPALGAAGIAVLVTLLAAAGVVALRRMGV